MLHANVSWQEMGWLASSPPGPVSQAKARKAQELNS